MSRRTVALGALALSALLALTACSSSSNGAAAGGDDLGLAKGGTLTVATEGTYRPFTYHDESGKLVGYDVEIIEAVAKKLDLKVEFQETQWDGIFAGLDAGRVDVIANQVSINPEREAKYLFTEPYTVSPSVVVVKDDDDSVKTFADLKGKKTAQSLTSNFFKLAEEAGADVTPIEGWAQAVELLRQGRVDATVNDKLTFLDYEKTDGPTGLKIAAETDPAKSAIVTTKNKKALVEKMDDALDALREDGTLATISEKYFGADVTQ
ncbi:transporter substrate-binding domain-containing protein [Microbacterium oleivorans]|uniref:L-cystine-binding protein tcyA n=1 Tax=Microbacterium oleivorans TaxID=273677 RepID=A0A031FUY8_9MICO|nr:transporter substrate-binding domain-containing protein [Microbacterium oleivorans]AZS43147.1 putative amino-acid ABC transporter-binding protein [Microbacterium oleivorans]EZP28016.1 L-cystine-binding protein tcyA [Microbacterium oleivorans]THE06577.1 transporter substrate-binding domain-containing protein [Microbacterium oleivorans]